jgi:glucose-1-phosphate thymidylyltransferase
MEKIMVGIICAGGLGTRLYPLTWITNKHLLPVYDRPMIYYPIQTLVKAGIKDIIIVTGGPFAGHFINALHDGKSFGIEHLHYAYQEKEGGISQAIACAEAYAEGEDVAVILGDNCTDADISQEVKEFTRGAHLFMKTVSDPERFGVPVFDHTDGDTIVAIEEKPKAPQSHYAVTGVYLYDSTVFDRIRGLTPSARGELEVTDLNNTYIHDGQMSWSILSGYWSDAGTFESLAEVNNYWRKIRGSQKQD